MKRQHRKAHIILWILVFFSTLFLIFFAFFYKPAEIKNRDLPDILFEESKTLNLSENGFGLA